MANQSAKKLLVRNAADIKWIKQVVAVSQIIYILLRIIYHWENFNFWHIIGYLMVTVSTGLCLFAAIAMANPILNSSGDILDPGSDLRLVGEYYFDLIYIGSFILLSTALITDWFWLLGLTIPGFAIYKLLSFFSNKTPGNQQNKSVDEKTEKKLQKKQERKERGKIKTMKR